MVRKKQPHHRNRFAFTMIELIFAIVIIAITVMSLPMVTQITSKGIESNIAQEAIFAASGELMGATAGYWDEKSMLDINVSHLSRVIDISNDCNDTTKLRPGHINQPYHRRCIDDTTINTAHNLNTAFLGADVFDLNDAAITQDIFVDTTTDAAGYKETYESNVTIIPTGNIKTIKITVRNSDGEIVTVLQTQSANIGEIDFYKRTF